MSNSDKHLKRASYESALIFRERNDGKSLDQPRPIDFIHIADKLEATNDSE